MINNPKVGQKVKFIVPGWRDFYGKFGVIICVNKEKFRPITIRFTSPVRFSHTWDCKRAELVVVSDKDKISFDKELFFCRQELLNKL